MIASARVLVLSTVLAALGCSRSGVAATPAHSIAGAPEPITGLPAHVEAKDGELSLFADFAAVEDDQIRVYLVNRTDHAIELPAQDGDPFVKLEVLDASGTWRRAQRHVYSDCGLSDQPIVLASESFVELRQWYPAHGQEATIRYAVQGELRVVSNALLAHRGGRFDLGELEAARTDAMSARDADIAHLEELLFGAAPQAAGWERSSTRDTALRRLGELPAEAAAPVLERFLDQRAVDANEYSRAVSSLNSIAPDRLAAYVRRTLAGPSGPARARVIDELPFMPTLTDDELLADLLARARDPKSPDVDEIVDYVAEYRTAEVESLLTAIESDTRYAEPLRIRARYQHEQWFGDDVVDLRISPRGNYSDGHALPVWMDVDIVNSGSKAIAFDYCDPREIVRLYLARSEGRDQTFFAPKRGVTWFPPREAASCRVRVEIAPGQSHRVSLAVADSFAVPAGDRLVVWASVRLPGLHRVAQLGGGGAGINPRR